VLVLREAGLRSVRVSLCFWNRDSVNSAQLDAFDEVSATALLDTAATIPV
jgi:hypothetical protein